MGFPMIMVHPPERSLGIAKFRFDPFRFCLFFFRARAGACVGVAGFCLAAGLCSSDWFVATLACTPVFFCFLWLNIHVFPPGGGRGGVNGGSARMPPFADLGKQPPLRSAFEVPVEPRPYGACGPGRRSCVL